MNTRLVSAESFVVIFVPSQMRIAELKKVGSPNFGDMLYIIFSSKARFLCERLIQPFQAATDLPAEVANAIAASFVSTAIFRVRFLMVMAASRIRRQL